VQPAERGFKFPTPRVEFLDSIGLTQDVPARIVLNAEQLVRRFRRHIVDALPAFHEFVSALRRIEQSPPVTDIETF
jgi:hypothetical protein